VPARAVIITTVAGPTIQDGAARAAPKAHLIHTVAAVVQNSDIPARDPTQTVKARPPGNRVKDSQPGLNRNQTRKAGLTTVRTSTAALG